MSSFNVVSRAFEMPRASLLGQKEPVMYRYVALVWPPIILKVHCFPVAASKEKFATRVTYINC